MSVFVYILLRCIENRLVFTVNVNDFHANELLLQLLLLIKKIDSILSLKQYLQSHQNK